MCLARSNSRSVMPSSAETSFFEWLSNENSKLSTTLSRVVLDQLKPCECRLSMPFSALAYGRSGCLRFSLVLLLLRRLRGGVLGVGLGALFVNGS